MEPINTTDNVELQQLNDKKQDSKIEVLNKEDLVKKSSIETTNNQHSHLIIPTHSYSNHQSENDHLKSEARPVTASVQSNNNSEGNIEEEEEEEGSENLEKSNAINQNQRVEKAFYLANICLQLGNIEDAVHYSDEMILTSEGILNKDMQRVLIGAYSNLIVPLRASWRQLCQIETEEKVAKKMINEIKILKQNQIAQNCEKFIKMINENILTRKLTDEEEALFLKVKADHYRYLAEITQGHQLYINKQNAFHFYKEAYMKAENFDDLNSTKLNIALNYSVFLYEILNKRINSFFFAKEALYKALRSLKNCEEDELTNEDMRDTLMIIEVLNKNVEDWYKEEVGDIFESAKERIALGDKDDEMVN